MNDPFTLENGGWSMGIFSEIAAGFVDGLCGNGAQQQESGRIERLCAQLGWAIDERDRQKIVLHFKDPLVGIRKVYISHGNEPLVLFAVYSMAILPADSVPPEISSHLLMQSAELAVGGWQASVTDEGEVLFCIRYVASGVGLTPPLFKFICEKMIRGAGEFDAKMQQAGLLGS